MRTDVDFWAKRYSAALFDFSEITLAVLKGHLVLEEVVDGLLEALVRNPKEIEDARLTFAKRVQVLRSLIVEPDHRVWSFVYRFNSVRNHLAHSVEANRGEQLLKSLYDDAVSVTSHRRTPDEPPGVQVALVLGLITGTLSRLAGVGDSMPEGSAVVRSDDFATPCSLEVLFRFPDDCVAGAAGADSAE